MSEHDQNPQQPDSIAVSVQVGGDPLDPTSGRTIQMPSIPTRLPVIQASGQADIVSALQDNKVCGNCRYFDRQSRAELAVTKMFTSLWTDERWNQQWHDPNSFGYCRGQHRRTAVESTATGCESWTGTEAIRSFFGQRWSR